MVLQGCDGAAECFRYSRYLGLYDDTGSVIVGRRLAALVQ